MPTHQFSGVVSWVAGGEGIAASNHVVSFPGCPPIEVSAAPQYKGDPSRLNPEELLIAAVASCQLLTYLALAPRAGVEVLAYDDEPVGTLAIADRKMRVTEIVLRPRISVSASTDLTKAEALVETAHAGCFIANSVSCAIRIEPQITVA